MDVQQAPAAQQPREMMAELIEWKDPAIGKPSSDRAVLIWVESAGFACAYWGADTGQWCLTSGINHPAHAVLAWADVFGPFDDQDDEPWERDDDMTFAMLQLVGGHDVPFEALAGWSDEQCRLAEEWAGSLHVRASDNDDVEVPPMPAWVSAHAPKVPA